VKRKRQGSKTSLNERFESKAPPEWQITVSPPSHLTPPQTRQLITAQSALRGDELLPLRVFTVTRIV